MTFIDFSSPAFWIFLGCWVIQALVAGAIALGRERDGAIWMTAALVLGPVIWLPILIFRPPGQEGG